MVKLHVCTLFVQRDYPHRVCTWESGSVGKSALASEQDMLMLPASTFLRNSHYAGIPTPENKAHKCNVQGTLRFCMRVVPPWWAWTFYMQDLSKL